MSRRQNSQESDDAGTKDASDEQRAFTMEEVLARLRKTFADDEEQTNAPPEQQMFSDRIEQGRD